MELLLEKVFAFVHYVSSYGYYAVAAALAALKSRITSVSINLMKRKQAEKKMSKKNKWEVRKRKKKITMKTNFKLN